MKPTKTTLFIYILVIATILLTFIGCSDMLETLGNISLTIDLDTPEVEVASYTLEGNLVDPTTRFTLNNINVPRHTLTGLKQGRWTLCVKAFDDQGNQIGIGTKAVDLKEGQILDTSLLVVFSQSTPLSSDFTITGPSRHDSREGSLTGTTVKMEYRLASAAEDAPFTVCSAGTTLLIPGTYKIRYAAAHGLEASECLTVTVPQFQPIQLTITNPSLSTAKEYDGTNSIFGSVTPGTLGGVLSGDEVSVHAQATTYDSASVGTDKTITVSYSLSGADELNYLKPADTTNLGVIGKKQLTVNSRPTFTASKTYNGNTSIDGGVTSGTLVGVVGTDDVTISSATRYDSKNAGTNTSITTVYTLLGEDKDNYSKPIDDVQYGSISKMQITASGTQFNTTKTYDGTANISITSNGTLLGVVADDEVTLDSVVGTYNNAAVGTNKAYTIRYTISGNDAANYTVSDVTGNTGTITKATMTGTLNITGTPAYGQMLIVQPSLTNSGTPTYQWKRNGTAISWATDLSYTLVASDIGATITVTATAGGESYQGSITSSPTTQVVKALGPSINGTINGYFPSLPATQTIINFTGFTANLSGLEARVAHDGTTYDGYADIEIDSRGRAMILMPSTVTTATKVQLRYKETATAFAGSPLELSLAEQSLAVGDYYAEGVIAYFFTNSDPGFVSGELHGLIAAKSDSSPAGCKWSNNTVLQIGTGVGLGTGSANTDAIILALDSSEIGLYAAKEARSYTNGDYTDWFLPSWHELLRLRDNRFLIGNFYTTGSSAYMSSSESTQGGWPAAPYYHAVQFDGNLSDWVYDKYSAAHIRAVRYF